MAKREIQGIPLSQLMALATQRNRRVAVGYTEAKSMQRKEVKNGR